MLRKYLLVPALIATLSTGCFTALGVVVGRSVKTPDGKKDPYAVGRGALVGAVIDVALVTAIVLSAEWPGYGIDDSSERR